MFTFVSADVTKSSRAFSDVSMPQIFCRLHQEQVLLCTLGVSVDVMQINLANVDTTDCLKERIKTNNHSTRFNAFSHEICHHADFFT
jgi:hypothetical protein